MIGVRLLLLLLCGLLSCRSAQAGDLLVGLGPGSAWQQVVNRANCIAANRRNDLLGISSVGTPGQRNFDEQIASVTFIAGDNTLQLAAFSDDGINLSITDLTTGQTSSNILQNKGVGQSLPNLNQSLKPVNYGFQAGHEYQVTIDYMNTLYTGDGDTDGALLIAYGGAISGILFDQYYLNVSIPVMFYHSLPMCECGESGICGAMLDPTVIPSPTPDDFISSDAPITAFQLPATGVHEVIQDETRVGFGDRRLRVIKKPGNAGYVIETWDYVTSWYFWGDWQMRRTETFSVAEFESLYFLDGSFDPNQFSQIRIQADMAGAGMAAVRTGQQATVTASIFAVFLPSPDDLIWGAMLSKYGIRCVGAFIEKRVNGIWKRAEGAELDDALKKLKDEAEAAGRTITIEKKAIAEGKTVKRIWTAEDYNKWKSSVTFVEETAQAPWADYQRRICGKKAQLTEPGYNADGISGTSILEAKYVRDPSDSPYTGTGYEPVRIITRAEIRNELERGAKNINSCSTPLTEMRFITNTDESETFLKKLIEELKEELGISIPVYVDKIE